MSIINQDIRYSSGNTDDNNPEALYEFVKPSRIIHDSGPPSSTDGQLAWYYIDNGTGKLYEKKRTGWIDTGYSFSGGAGGRIDGAENVGGGARVYARLSSPIEDTLEFRTITSNNNKLLFSTTADEIDIEPNLIKDDVGLPLVENIKNEQLQPLLEPTVNDDETRDFQVGSFWIQSLPQAELWICKDATAGAAVWELIGAGGGGNLSNCVNIGAGIGVFSQLNGAGTIAEFKSLLSSSGKITFVDAINQIDFGIDINKSDVDLGLVDNTKNTQNLTTASPSPFNDISQGYQDGSLWVQTSPDLVIWICKDPSAGAAVWEEYERNTPDYLEARFTATFNISLNGKDPFLKYLIPHESNFSFTLLEGFTVEEQVGISYILAQEPTGKRYLVNYSVSGYIAPALGVNETLEFFFVSNLAGTPIIPNSSNFWYINNAMFAQMSSSFIWIPSPGVSITPGFTFFSPIASTLNITAFTLTITEI